MAGSTKIGCDRVTFELNEMVQYEDERDADQLHKRAALAKESQALAHSTCFGDNDEIVGVSSEIMTAKKNLKLTQYY